MAPRVSTGSQAQGWRRGCVSNGETRGRDAWEGNKEGLWEGLTYFLQLRQRLQRQCRAHHQRHELAIVPDPVPRIADNLSYAQDMARSADARGVEHNVLAHEFRLRVARATGMSEILDRRLQDMGSGGAVVRHGYGRAEEEPGGLWSVHGEGELLQVV